MPETSARLPFDIDEAIDPSLVTGRAGVPLVIECRQHDSEDDRVRPDPEDHRKPPRVQRNHSSEIRCRSRAAAATSQLRHGYTSAMERPWQRTQICRSRPVAWNLREQKLIVPGLCG